MEAPRTQETPMPTVEERLAFVEGRQQDHFAAIDDLRTTVRDFRADTARQFADVRDEFTKVRAEIKDLRTELRGELAAHRAEAGRQFTWLVGIQVATLVAMVGALAGAYYK